MGEPRPRHRRGRAEGHHEDFTRLFRSHKETYLRNLLPYPDCEACGGTGVRRGLHNPEGRWFSWEAVEDAEGFGGDSRVAARGLSPPPGKHRFWSLLTSDGGWLDRDRRIGPPAGDGDETEEEHDRRWRSAEEAWEREIVGQLREHAGCTAVSVRCVAAVGSVDGYVSGLENSFRRPREGWTGTSPARVTPRTPRRYRYQDAALSVGRDGFWRATELRAEAPGVGAWTGRSVRW